MAQTLWQFARAVIEVNAKQEKHISISLTSPTRGEIVFQFSTAAAAAVVIVLFTR